jgi:hypothetical protein
MNEDSYDLIYKAQKELMTLYQPIEEWPTIEGLDLSLPYSRALIKDVILRAIEELVEADELLRESKKITDIRKELPDFHHFIMEILVFTKVGVEDFNKLRFGSHPDLLDDLGAFPMSPLDNPEKVRLWFWEITYYLDHAGRALNHKPWRITPQQPDLEYFYLFLKKAYLIFIIGYSHIPETNREGIVVDYMAKNKKNIARIKNNY